MVCSGCDKQFDDGFNFCPHCGRVAQAEQPSATHLTLDLAPEAGRESPPSLSPATHEKEYDKSPSPGAIVFASFAAISLLVAIAKGFVPLYLIESAGWAWAAWYWNTRRERKRLAEALVIILGIVVLVGEGVHFANWMDSGPQNRSAISPDSILSQNHSASSVDPAGDGQPHVPPGFVLVGTCPEALPSETVPKPLAPGDASKVVGSGATIDDEGQASLTYQNMTNDQCITSVVVELYMMEDGRILKEKHEVDSLMLGPGKATTFSIQTKMWKRGKDISLAEWHTLSVVGFHAPQNPYAEFGGVPVNSSR